MKNLFTLIITFFFFMQSQAQVNDFTLDPDTGLFKEVARTGWVKFADNVDIPPDKIFENFKTSFGLNSSFQMKIAKSRVDEIGFSHTRYHQHLNNIKIKGGEYIIHGKGGRSVTGNGQIITPENIQTGIALSEAAALEAALKLVNAKKYYWEDPAKELKAGASRKSTRKTYYPKADWIYVWDNKSNKLTLTYSFPIYAFDKGKSGTYFVDAVDGKILDVDPAEHNCDETIFPSNWYGFMTIWTNEDGDYDLEDDCQESVYGVYDVNGIMVSEPNNNWLGPWLGSCAQSLISIKLAYIWYHIAFTRLGHDDNDGELDITQGYVFPNEGNNNASYSYDPIGDDEVRVGLGDHWDVIDDYNTIDILGHEFTHGVTRYEANLEYEFESGALNESFSDIFGEWLEFKVFGTNNWLIGHDRIINGCPAPLRYMVDPGGTYSTGPCNYDFNQPNTLFGDNWYFSAGCDPDDDDSDHCGVHTNSGVQNQMFYLLSQGGSGYNNLLTCHAPANSGGYFWSVTGIGINDAGRIAYRVLVDYLTSNSGYIDSRNAWVHAAEDLFGPCSFQAIQTGRAWYAVNISPPSPGTMTLCNVNYGNTPQLIATPDIIETQPGCFVNILNTGNMVEFSSGSKIRLRDGFRATWGSNFNTTITDCGFANY